MGYSRRVILVIDDDADILQAIAASLPESEYEVHTATSAAEGFGLLATIPRPSLVLLDLRMPGMTGGELLQQMKKHPEYANLSVVIISAVPEEGRKLPAIARLKKPFTRTELLEAVERFSIHPGAIMKQIL